MNTKTELNSDDADLFTDHYYSHFVLLVADTHSGKVRGYRGSVADAVVFQVVDEAQVVLVKKWGAVHLGGAKAVRRFRDGQLGRGEVAEDHLRFGNGDGQLACAEIRMPNLIWR